MNQFYEIAKWYRDNGFCIIPLCDFNYNLTLNDSKCQNKQPAIKWSEITELPTDMQLSEWFICQGLEQMAIICGKISGVTIIDKDVHRDSNGDIIQGCPLDFPNIISPICVKTSTGGEQHYFKYTDKIKTKIHFNNVSIDILNDKRIALVPPTIGWISTPGNIIKYEFVSKKFSRYLLPEFPQEILNLIPENQPNNNTVSDINWGQLLISGQRNSKMSKIMASILHGINPSMWNTKGRSLCLAYKNTFIQQNPEDPYSDKEFEMSFESAKNFMNKKNNPNLNLKNIWY